MTNANTADNVTLRIGTETAKTLLYNGEAVTALNTWEKDEVISVYFDGTNYQASNSQGGGGGKMELTLAYILSNHERRISENTENLEQESEYLRNNKLGEDEELVIAKAFNSAIGGGSSESSLSGTVTITNSDCIVILGSSFGAGYTVAGKHWSDIVSMFSDYCFQNLSLSGTSSLDRMNSLLAGTITPRQNARYALVVNSENTSVNHQHLLKSIDNLCKVCLSMGMEPIVGTSYRNYQGNYQENMYVSSIYRDYCDKHNYIFMDAAKYYQLLQKGRYDFKRQGSHLGEREIPVVAYAYMKALHGLERPIKSLKVFMPREEVNDIDSLVFNNNIERVKKFKELLMNSYADAQITFPLGYGLLSVILPSTQKNTKLINLDIFSSSDITVYVKKMNERPWPVKASTCTRFHIEDEIDIPAVNDTYSYNGTIFTVKHVNTQAEDGSYGAFCDIYCLPDLESGSTTGGTLSIESGQGSASIVFSSYNVKTSYTPDTLLIDEFNGGHWVEVDKDSKGTYTLTDLYGIMDVDQIDFLIKSDNEESFTITNNVKVSWQASELKNNYRRFQEETISSLYKTDGEELLSEPTFGPEGTTQTTWKDGNGNALVSEGNYEKVVKGASGVYPMDATSIIKISDSISMGCTIPIAKLPNYGQIEIEVIARNFGTSIDSVTENSCDFNTLILGFGGDGSAKTYSELTDEVGLFWKICRFTIDILNGDNIAYKRKLPFKIYAEKAGMEIARVSAKIKNNNI